MPIPAIRILITLALMIVAASLDGHTADCASLIKTSLPDTSLTTAQVVPAGRFLPPYGRPIDKLPAFCRLAGVIRPSSDSDIRFEVWLPASDWNGKFLSVGNGGFAGSVNYNALANNLRRGYATAATDTEHEGDAEDASWAFKHPEKVIDYGYRGLHATAENAKALIRAFYSSPARHSYFDSCSDGGREALMEAQRFPEDFDGILAGAPANFWTHLLTSALWDAQATTLDESSYIPSPKLPAIARSVDAACDAQDGVADGILGDPRQCRFDPATMLCKDGDSPTCLTAPQVTALQKLYEGARAADARRIFPGFLPGAEEGEGGWAAWITGSAPGKGLLFTFANGFFSNMVYGKADWDYKTANLDQAVQAADDKTARTLNATDPHLEPFKARGGKLILYHGWNDPAISALNTIDYYETVVKKMGKPKVEVFTRLYMVPGMLHCSDGPGANFFGEEPGGPADAQHNIKLALEQWVEKATAP